MTDRSFLKWPFLEPRHRELAERLEAWAAANFAETDHHGDVDEACRRLVGVLGRDGWLKFSAPGDGENERIDVRTLALIRETLARHSGLADFAFATHGFRERVQARQSPPSRCRSRSPARTSPISPLQPAATEMASSSTAKRPGFPTAALPISMLCLREPGKHRERGGCPLSSLKLIIPA